MHDREDQLDRGFDPSLDYAGAWGPGARPEVPAERTPPRRTRRQRRWPWVLLALVVLVCAVGAGTLWYVEGPQKDATYLSALDRAELGDTYANDEVAVTSGKAFCESLRTGAKTEGYASDRISVQHYCPEFVSDFVVVPTPEEVQENYLTELREKGLGGSFSSDATAVARAKAFCDQLEDGADQEGTPADGIAVKHYCDSFSDGFHVLEKAQVDGTFTLYEPDPSVYFPSIVTYGDLCEGAGGYDDITTGTEVLIESGAGEILARTNLGLGEGTSVMCEFEFSFNVMEGHDDYIVSVSHRGEQHYTFEQLRNQGVALQLGS